MNLERGDILFTRDNSLISRSIRWLTSADFSHVLVYAGDGLVIESAWSGVVITGLKRYMSSKTVCTAVKPPTSLDRNIFLSEMRKLVGDGYDYRLLLAHALRSVFRFITLDLKAYDEPSKWLCYEVIGNALNKGGIDLGTPIRDLNPQLLYEKLKNLGVVSWTL